MYFESWKNVKNEKCYCVTLLIWLIKAPIWTPTFPSTTKKYLVDLPYWRGTVHRAVGGKLLYERSGLQQQNYCRKIFETNFDHFMGKIFVIYDPALQRIRLRFQFRIRNHLAQIFNNKKFVKKNIAFSVFNARSSIFPRKLASNFFLTFVLNFFWVWVQIRFRNR